MSETVLKKIKLKEETTFSLFLSKNPLPNGIAITEIGDEIRISHDSGQELNRFMALLKRKKVKFKEL